MNTTAVAHPRVSLGASLLSLPPELVGQIISHATLARTLRNFGLASRALYSRVEADGWAAFVNNRFSSFPTPPHWRDAAHALTTLSRCFDRRSFIAQDAGPDFGPDRTRYRTLPGDEVAARWRRSATQTIGYQPVIDSHEVFYGSRWNDRKETVAWGAGSELIVKVEERGTEVQMDHDRGLSKPKDGTVLDDQIYDLTGNSRQTWMIYREPDCLEGIHDITSLGILKSQQTGDGPDLAVKLIIGRASGGIKMVEVSRKSSSTVKTFDCGNATVRCADINDAPSPLLAACLGDSKISLYETSGAEEIVRPVSEVNCTSAYDQIGSRCWSSHYIDREKLAIGRGISKGIVYVYALRPDGLTPEPIRTFSSDIGIGPARSTSAYPIVSVPQSSTSRENDGNLFFSGGYDGVIRLHDMRSPRACVAILSDPIDNSAIFSLTMIGRERVAAGASSHGLVKFFDLRMAGGKTYSYRDAVDGSAATTVACDHDTSNVDTSGWNMFAGRGGRSLPSRQRPRESTPVYSLSRPSPISPSLYIGLENRVVHMNFTSAADNHPDPLFNDSITRHAASGSLNIKKTWDPHDRVLNLAMYEQEGPRKTQLIHQLPVRDFIRTLRTPLTESDYDERWGEHEWTKNEDWRERWGVRR